MDYEWDDAKAAANRRRHGIDFVDAIAAIEDPSRVEEVDSRLDYGEERMRVLGMAAGNILLVITTTRGVDTCRIISARRATRHEQDRYYANYPQTR
ncbi:MAG: BrnT family toxin [Thermoanaerobaculia bacterium]|nr:BrnT family toxin [Thermoanaerobaculia bacterium]